VELILRHQVQSSRADRGLRLHKRWSLGKQAFERSVLVADCSILVKIGSSAKFRRVGKQSTCLFRRFVYTDRAESG